MDRKQLATALHKQGFNCCQAVVCSFCDVLGYDPVTTFKMSEGFGGGMGTFSTCGAVSAMAMVIGMKQSDGNLDNPKTKHESYRMMKKATQKFQELNQSTICREIKGMDTGKVLRSCDGCIQDAVDILNELLLGIKDDERE